MQPVICLITDRQRLRSASGDEAASVQSERWKLVPPQVRAAALAGVDLVQVRERDLDGGPLAVLVRACVEAVAGTRTRVLVNDRVDVALAAGAHGVHLRADSLPAARVRQIAPRGFLIGRSVHSVAEARLAWERGGLDYLMFGTVFATPSKPGRPEAGIATLAAVAAATPLPVLAVGGITLATVGVVAQSDAAGVAAIGVFGTEVPGAIAALVPRMRQAFDSSQTVP